MSNYSTTALLPNNWFLVWMWSIGNIFWWYYKYNESETANQADTSALRNDFWMV